MRILSLFDTSVWANDKICRKDTVISLHGLGRTERSMATIGQDLIDRRYHIDNIDHPSTHFSISQLSANYVAPAVVRARLLGGRIPFVTHSMGGILVRHYLATHPTEAIGRVVMLAPPNRGSEIIDTLGEYALFRYALGPAAQQLSTRLDSLPNTLPPLSCEIGIIAGDNSINPASSYLISGRDDGKVSVAATTLEEMRDHIVLHANHTSIMEDPGALQQIGCFLESGSFRHLDESIQITQQKNTQVGYTMNTFTSTPQKTQVRRRSLPAMAATYCFGVFNDNYFKQAAMLLAVAAGINQLQGWTAMLFALPFILFSAHGGWCADRLPKKIVVVLAKIFELAAMLVGAARLVTGSWPRILAMVFLMGLQSTFFSPALSCSIPELTRQIQYYASMPS